MYRKMHNFCRRYTADMMEILGRDDSIINVRAREKIGIPPY